jgi:hypothetical protein
MLMLQMRNKMLAEGIDWDVFQAIMRNLNFYRKLNLTMGLK